MRNDTKLQTRYVMQGDTARCHVRVNEYEVEWSTIWQQGVTEWAGWWCEWGGWVYLSFFLMRSWLEWPHFFLRQFTARGWRRA